MLLTDSTALAGASVVAVAGVLAGLLMLGYAARQPSPSPLPSLTFTIPNVTSQSFWHNKVIVFTFVAYRPDSEYMRQVGG
jgi:hypothetical protein